MIEAFFLAFGTLFPIVNPFSTSFVFYSLTQKDTKATRRKYALSAALTAIITLLVFLFFGKFLLDFFNITVYAFRVAGGLYLGKISFDMLNPKLRRQPQNFEGRENQGIIPIGIPLLSGPGSMTAVLVLANEGAMSMWATAIAIVTIGLLSWIILRNSHRIIDRLGKTGVQVVERVLGLIVLVVAVQFLFNGISGYLESL